MSTLYWQNQWLILPGQTGTNKEDTTLPTVATGVVNLFLVPSAFIIGPTRFCEFQDFRRSISSSDHPPNLCCFPNQRKSAYIEKSRAHAPNYPYRIPCIQGAVAPARTKTPTDEADHDKISLRRSVAGRQMVRSRKQLFS